MQRLIFTFSLLFTLVCCKGGGEIGYGGREDTTALRVAVLPTMDCLPLFVADECGMFRSEGLDVLLVVYDAAMDADTAFVNGYVDAVATDVVKSVMLPSDSDEVKVVLNYDLPLYLLSSEESKVLDTRNIKDKIVALTRNSWVDYATDKIQKSLGLTPEQLNKPQINNLYLRSRMLIQNQYDGAVLPEPFAALCEAEGSNRLCSTDMFGLRMGALVTYGRTLHKRGDEFQRLEKVYNAAVDTINSRIARNENLLHFLPLNEKIPDALVRVGHYEHSALVDSLVIEDIKTWIDGRKLQ